MQRFAFCLVLGIALMNEFFPSPVNAAINGMLDVSYRNQETKSGDRTTESTSLAQRYTVNYVGGLYDRRYATVNAGITYDMLDSEYIDTKTSNKSAGFNFQSVLLPRTPIPITLFANRFTSDSQSRPNPGYRTTSTIYGLYWNLPFKGRIPEISLSYTESRTEDNNPTNANEKLDRSFSMTMAKRKKQSFYNLRYTFGSQQNVGRGIDTTIQTLDFKGWWRVSSNSTVDLTTSLLDSEGDKTFSSRLHYDLNYSRDTTARADYSYDRSESQGNTSATHSFSASGYHRFTPKITSTTSYSYSFSDSGDTTTTSQYISEGVTAMLLPTLNVNGDVSYTSQQSTIGSETYRANLSGVFHKSFPRYQFSSGANVSYSVASSTTTSRSFSRSEYLGLSSRNFRLVNLTGSLTNTHTDDSTSTSRDENRFAVSATSNYFRRLTLAANYDYTVIEDSKKDAEDTRRDFSTFDARATYAMGLGMMVGANYTLRKASESIDEEHISFNWNWGFVLFRRISVSLSAREERRIADDTNNYTNYSFGSSLSYRIGRLSLSLEQNYRKEKRKLNDTEEKSYYIKATRSF